MPTFSDTAYFENTSQNLYFKCKAWASCQGTAGSGFLLKARRAIGVYSTHVAASSRIRALTVLQRPGRARLVTGTGSSDCLLIIRQGKVPSPVQGQSGNPVNKSGLPSPCLTYGHWAADPPMWNPANAGQRSWRPGTGKCTRIFARSCVWWQVKLSYYFEHGLLLIHTSGITFASPIWI